MRRLIFSLLASLFCTEAYSIDYGACVSRPELLEALSKEEQITVLAWDNIFISDSSPPVITPMRVTLDRYSKRGYWIKINEEQKYCLLGVLSGLHGNQVLVLNPEKREVSDRSLQMKGEPARERGGISNSICRLAARDSTYVTLQAVVTIRNGEQYLQTLFGKVLGEKLLLNTPDQIKAAAKISPPAVYTESNGKNVGSEIVANLNLSPFGLEVAKAFQSSKNNQEHEVCKYEKWLRDEWEKKEYDIGSRKMKGGSIDSALEALEDPEVRKQLRDRLNGQKTSK